MPMVYAMPYEPMMFDMPCPPLRYAHRRMPSCSPSACFASPFFFFAALFLAPMIFRMIFFVLINLAFFGAIFGMSNLAVKAVSFLCDDELSWGCCSTNETKSTPGSRPEARKCPCPMAACFAKMKSACVEKDACASHGKTSTVRETLKSASPTRRDWSSVRVDKSDESMIRLVVAAPGVKPSDIEVSVVNETLIVKGESSRGETEVFCVDRQFASSGNADLDTASCTHEDGVLTIILQRKASKRIPVMPVAEAASEATQMVDPQPTLQSAAQTPIADDELASEQPLVSSEDEWVPLADPEYEIEKSAQEKKVE